MFSSLDLMRQCKIFFKQTFLVYVSFVAMVKSDDYIQCNHRNEIVEPEIQSTLYSTLCNEN